MVTGNTYLDYGAYGSSPPLLSSPGGSKSCMLKLAHFVLLLPKSSGRCEMKKLGLSSNQYAFVIRPIGQVMALRGLNL